MADWGAGDPSTSFGGANQENDSWGANAGAGGNDGWGNGGGGDEQSGSYSGNCYNCGEPGYGVLRVSLVIV